MSIENWNKRGKLEKGQLKRQYLQKTKRKNTTGKWRKNEHKLMRIIETKRENWRRPEDQSTHF